MRNILVFLPVFLLVGCVKAQPLTVKEKPASHFFDWLTVSSLYEIREATNHRPSIVFIDDGSHEELLHRVWALLPHFEHHVLYSAEGRVQSETGWVADLYAKRGRTYGQFPFCFVARKIEDRKKIVWDRVGIEGCTQELLNYLDPSHQLQMPEEAKSFIASFTLAKKPKVFATFPSFTTSKQNTEPTYPCRYQFDGQVFTVMQETPCYSQ